SLPCIKLQIIPLLHLQPNKPLPSSYSRLAVYASKLVDTMKIYPLLSKSTHLCNMKLTFATALLFAASAMAQCSPPAKTCSSFFRANTCLANCGPRKSGSPKAVACRQCCTNALDSCQTPPHQLDKCEALFAQCAA